jgi:hypothetical protein
MGNCLAANSNDGGLRLVGIDAASLSGAIKLQLSSTHDQRLTCALRPAATHAGTSVPHAQRNVRSGRTAWTTGSAAIPRLAAAQQYLRLDWERKIQPPTAPAKRLRALQQDPRQRRIAEATHMRRRACNRETLVASIRSSPCVTRRVSSNKLCKKYCIGAMIGWRAENRMCRACHWRSQARTTDGVCCRAVLMLCYVLHHTTSAARDRLLLHPMYSTTAARALDPQNTMIML